MSFRLLQLRQKRVISLTPMIDVVFLLLVFFMLAARFDQTVTIELSPIGPGSTPSSDAPRLIDILADSVRLNGIPVAEESLVIRLLEIGDATEALTVLRPAEGTSIQRMLDVAERLRAGGVETLAVVE